MKKNGFTLAEMIATITILSILSTVAVVSVTKYLKDTNKKEEKILRTTILSAFQNYRIHETIKEGQKVLIDDLQFTNPLSYSRHTCATNTNNVISYYVKTGVKEEGYCIRFTCNGKEIMNDFNTNTLCK